MGIAVANLLYTQTEGRVWLTGFSPGKSDYLAMEATLRLYKEPEEALDKIPLRMISMPLQKVDERAQKF